MPPEDLEIRRAAATELPDLQRIREAAFAAVMAMRLDRDGGIGEIALNGVHPDYAGRGIGTALYELALDEMAAAGLKVATVSTGGDPSHAPARRAYEKAGFDVGIPSVWMCCDLAARAARRGGGE